MSKNFKVVVVLLACLLLLFMNLSSSFATTAPALMPGGFLPVLNLRPTPSNIVTAHIMPKAALRTQLPPSVDWSVNMPPAGDQGSEGSCTAWATAYAEQTYLETLNHGWSNQTALHQFSPSYIYNQLCGGVDAGLSLGQALNCLVSQGCDTLGDFPYVDGDIYTRPTSNQIARAANFKDSGWWNIFYNSGDIASIKNALINGPVVAGTYVYWEAGWWPYKGIAEADIKDATSGGHSICLVGYDDSHQTDDGLGAFKFINSWGTGWGLGGYGWISYTYAANQFFEADLLGSPIGNATVPYSVSGNIGNSFGTTNSGVALTFTATSGSGSVPYAVYSNANGNWSQSGFAESTSYTVTPSLQGYSFAPTSINFNSNSTNCAVLNFVATAGTVIAISPTTISTINAEKSFSQTFEASGGIGPYTYAESGALPHGITFANGTLSGTTVAVGVYPLAITATDTNHFTGTQTLTLTVAAPKIAISPTTLAHATAGKSFSQTFTASGDTGPYAYAESGALPHGIAFKGNILSGKTSSLGSYPITITVTSYNHFKGTKSYTLTVIR
jgi:hypothetical protein